MEIGTAENLVALHSWRAGTGGERPVGVDVVSGWASEDPHLWIARDVALERLGDDVWVVIWEDNWRRGRAVAALAAWDSGAYVDSVQAAIREKQLLYALHVAELERDGYRLFQHEALREEDEVHTPESDTAANAGLVDPVAVDVNQCDGTAGVGRATVDLAGVWCAVTELLRDEVLSQQGWAYLRFTRLRAIVDDTALLAVPDARTRDVIENQLRPAITEAVSRHLGRSVQVAVTVRLPDTDARTAPTGPSPAVAPVPKAKAKVKSQVPTGRAPRSEDGRRGAGSVMPGPMRSTLSGGVEAGTGPESGLDRIMSDPSGHVRRRGEGRPRGVRWSGKGLDPRYTFENFVIGSANRFAHAAAVAVAESPAKSYNPLFLYGGRPEQRTHLLHAIGHYAMAVRTATSVRYVSGQDFTDEVLDSVRDDKTGALERGYRDVDILLVDDIQFLENRERAWDKFLHKFDTLHCGTRQIVIASDRSPKQLSMFDDRLRTRFEWGLLADLESPDLAARFAILQKKASQERLAAPLEVLEYIAGRVTSSVRELEGALVRVTAFASLNRSLVDLAVAEEVLRDLVPGGSDSVITADQVMAAISAYFGVSIEDLVGRSRSPVMVNARQVGMYLCRELTDLSLPRIGQLFGGRDHTTVMHADRKVRQLMGERRSLFNQIAEVSNQIRRMRTHQDIDVPLRPALAEPFNPVLTSTDPPTVSILTRIFRVPFGHG